MSHCGEGGSGHTLFSVRKGCVTANVETMSVTLRYHGTACSINRAATGNGLLKMIGRKMLSQIETVQKAKKFNAAKPISGQCQNTWLLIHLISRLTVQSARSANMGIELIFYRKLMLQKSC